MRWRLFFFYYYFLFVVQTYNIYLLRIEIGAVSTLHTRDKIRCYETYMYVILSYIFNDISLSLEVKIIIYA